MRDEVLGSSRRVAERELEGVRKRLDDATAEAFHAGSLHGSRYFHVLAERSREGFRQLCNASSSQIAKIEGAGSLRYATALDEMLNGFRRDVLEMFPLPGAGRQSSAFDTFAREVFANLEQQLAQEQAGAIEDLRLGVAGGESVTKHPSVNVDNRGGSAQIAVGGSGNLQTVHGNLQAASGIDTRSLLDILELVRAEAREAPLEMEHKDAIEDAVVALEHEAKAQEPNKGRVKRLLTRIVDIGREQGVPMARSVLEEYLKSLVTGA